MDLSKLQLKPHKLFHHLDEVLKWQKGEPFAPIYVEISPTDLCNQNCHFCYTDYIKHQGKSIPGDLLIKIFEDLGKAGVKSVQVQGTGEPFINKSLPDAIIAGYETGLSIGCGTNGYYLNEKTLTKILPYMEWIRFSSMEANSELYAKSHQTPERHFDVVTKNMCKAVELRKTLNPEVILSSMFLPFEYNTPYVVDVTKLMKEIGIDIFLIKSPNLDSSKTPDHIWPRDTFKNYSKLLHEAKALEDEEFIVDVRFDQFELQKNEGPFKKNYASCYGMKFETMIDADCKVYPCLSFWRNEEFCLGDLTKNSFEEIWSSKKCQKKLNDIWDNYDPRNKCTFGCKQHWINESLWELKNPPMHKNFL